VAIPTLLIIDSFYDRPFEVRERVLSQEFKKFERAVYPGEETPPPFEIYPTIERISHYLRMPVSWREDTIRNGWFRLMRHDDPWKAKVHTDAFDYTAVVYLTPDGNAEGGTSFYRHKETGMSRLPYRPDPHYLEELRQKGITFQQMQEILNRDTNDDSAWEEIQRVEYKFNRLVIFEPSQFHTGSRLFGETRQTARMTQNFFLYLSR
jgi:hypothetical protein